MNQLELTIDRLDRAQVFKGLGYSRQNPAGESLLEKVESFAATTPLDIRAIYAKSTIKKCSSNSLFAGDTEINSPTFCTIAKDADSVFFCLVTASSEIEKQLYSCEDTMDALIIDTIGSVVVEQGVELLRKEIAEKYKQFVSLPFSPGYCDYPLSEQEKIFQNLGDRPLGVSYHPDSFMMSPTKTISFVVAAGTSPLETNPCTICQLTECQMRRR